MFEPDCVVTELTRCPTPSIEPIEGAGVADVPWGLVILSATLAVACVVMAVVTAIAIRRARAAASRTAAPRTAASPPATAHGVSAQPAASTVVDATATIDDLITLSDLADGPAIQAQVARALRRLGVEPIAVAVGAPFDPDMHAIVRRAAASELAAQGTVAFVVRPGWRTATAVIRPAEVAVHGRG